MVFLGQMAESLPMSALVVAIFFCTPVDAQCINIDQNQLDDATCAAVLETGYDPPLKPIDGRFYQANGDWLECAQISLQPWNMISPIPKSHAWLRPPVITDTSGAAPFDHVPYAMMRCANGHCVKASSVISVSKKACEIAVGIAEDSSLKCVKQ